ncbi:hypothetical protein G3545_12200 [Starkeya sp. ORNL1]|uniref:hypothetical protein n=1 Tax=Starkeya sp. ORNL1 TaxID=2709380 RepID=UPI0014644733|nr:hypothetical protein [Starkeya sp. ORNL1]QJP12174.1 hypothetical protein G3545_12200 [Starkeya sp. ORNL1]
MKHTVREFVMVERQRLRMRAEAAIESLLAILDEIDGDPDLENHDPELDNDGDWHEPELGWTGIGTGWRGSDLDGDCSRIPLNHDFEDEHDGCEPDEGDDEPDADSEPSLGWSPGESESAIYSLTAVDFEEEHDGSEPVNYLG